MSHGWIVLILPLFGLAFCLFRMLSSRSNGDRWKLAATVSMLVCFLQVIMLTAIRTSYESKVARHKSIQRVLDVAVETDGYGSSVTGVIQIRAVASNLDMAAAQRLYDDWRPFIPGSVIGIEPIE